MNTCSVTELADKKCRQAIRRIGKQHPGAFIVVTGCYAQLKPEEVSHIEGVDLVLGAEQKLEILQYLENLEKKEMVERLSPHKARIYVPSPLPARRTTVPVIS